jgi:hypothetical protein
MRWLPRGITRAPRNRTTTSSPSRQRTGSSVSDSIAMSGA